MGFSVASDDIRLMAEIGFAGIGRGRLAEAAAIFTAIQALRPEAEAGHVGAALAELAAGRPGPAGDILRAAPQTEAVLAFRALVHARAGDRRLSEEILVDLGFMRAEGPVIEIAKAAVSA